MNTRITRITPLVWTLAALAAPAALTGCDADTPDAFNSIELETGLDATERDDIAADETEADETEADLCAQAHDGGSDFTLDVNPANAGNACELVGYKYLGEYNDGWAMLSSVSGVPTPKKPATGQYICVFRRPTMYWFRCCGEYYMPVAGFEYATSAPYGDTVGVKAEPMPKGLSVSLAPVAEKLGVKPSLTHWFYTAEEEEEANSDCESGDSTIAFDEMWVPECADGTMTLPYISLPVHKLPLELPKDVEEFEED